MRALCVSIHDVAPRTWGACKQIAEAVRRVCPELPLTLLVVPRYHGDTAVPQEFARWITARLARGDELALHGYTHRDDSPAPLRFSERVQRQIYTAGEGEFAGLTREQARERIELGRQWFAERGWPVRGFVAPAWLVSPGTWDALSDFDFLYTTTLSRFHMLKQGISLRAPSVVYSTRSSWRRWTSRGWNWAVSRTAREMPLVRVGFHPADAAHPEIMVHALELLHRLSRDREPLTKCSVAQRLGIGAEQEIA